MQVSLKWLLLDSTHWIQTNHTPSYKLCKYLKEGNMYIKISGPSDLRVPNPKNEGYPKIKGHPKKEDGPVPDNNNCQKTYKTHSIPTHIYHN